MSRRLRHWTAQLAITGCCVGLPIAAHAQAQYPLTGAQPGVAQTGVRDRGAPAGTAQVGPNAGNVINNGAAAVTPRPRPEVEFQVSPEVVQALREWEHYTRGIQRLRGSFDRYTYDSTFLVERRAVGEFWYEKPDHARIDFRPAPDDRLPKPNASGLRVNPGKLGPNNQPYTVQPDSSSRWVCTGDALLQIDDDQKQYTIMDIPPSLQGDNISNSPLPFLFGMSAAAMQERYFLTLGSMHNPRGEGGRPATIHVVAYPKLQQQAREWKRAEVLLDPGRAFQIEGQPVYVPTAIKLLDPTGNQETVYVFHVASMKLNEGALLFRNPFSEPSGWLNKYTLLEHYRQPADPAGQQRPQTAEQQPRPPASQLR
ncbi:MAG: hypothetical protein R3B90_05250 [Planctomycetaceae bacterium]